MYMYLLLGLVALTACKDKGYDSLVKELADKDALITLAENRSKSLESLLEGKTREAEQLSTVVQELRAQPEKIKYVVKTRTIVKAAEPEVITYELPDSHEFRLGNGLTVARFEVDADPEPVYSFETYDLNFKAVIAITEDSSALNVKMNTSYQEDVWRDVPVDLIVVDTEKHPLLKPEVAIGATGSAGPDAGVDAGFSVYFPWWHPLEELDVWNPRVTVSGKQTQFGLDPLSYNVAKHIKFIDDLWLSAGGSINLKGEPSGSITIGTKL